MSVKSRSTLFLASVLVAALGAAAPTLTGHDVGLFHSWMSAPGQAQAQAAAQPFGLFERSNNGKYFFPLRPDYVIQYYGWYERFQAADAEEAWQAGSETFAELQTCGDPCDSNTSIPINAVIDGAYDLYLTGFARAVAAFRHPVLLTFDHEMNGNWYPWGDTDITPSLWVQAWQHVTSVISSIATNAVWVWAPNIEQGAASFAQYWPGNGYPDPHVNVVGLDGYFLNSNATWANTFSRSVADIKAISGGDYPFIVAEVGIPSADVDDASQIGNLITGAHSVGAVAIMYFDSRKWVLTPSEQSAFVRDVGRTRCHGSTGANGRCRVLITWR